MGDKKKGVDRHMAMANKLYPSLVKQVNSRVPKPGIVKRMADAFREITETSKGKSVDLSGYVRKSDVTKQVNKAVKEVNKEAMDRGSLALNSYQKDVLNAVKGTDLAVVVKKIALPKI